MTKEPDHKIVPLTVDVQNKEVTITSQYDNVNTTLADTDNMLASDDYDINGHQVYVNKGTTTIILYYPYFTQGMLLSAGALVAAILLLIGVRKHGKKQLERSLEAYETKNKEQNHNKKYIAIEILVGILVSLGIFLFLYLRGYQPAGEMSMDTCIRWNS